jgi:adenosine deaminase
VTDLSTGLDPRIEDLITAMPKVELHVHLEGTLEPEMLIVLAEKNGVEIPYSSAQEVRAAYEFSDLQSFLDVYYAGCGVLQTRQDFCDLTTAYLRRADADNVRHAEPFFDPQTHTDRGIAFDTVIGGILDGLAQGEAEFGITSGLILSFLRDKSEESALETLSLARPWLGDLIAVGLDSAEVGNPPEKFSQVFEEARKLGLLAVAHAGEEGGPELVTRTLDSLHVSRIDHGVRAIEDPQLISRLAREGIPLTVCPLSNLKLKVVQAIADIKLKSLLDSRVVATVNSDDPAYFGGYIAENFRDVTAALSLTRDDLFKLGENAILGSFASESRKRDLLGELRDVFSTV